MKIINNQDGTYTAVRTIKGGQRYTCTGLTPSQAVNRVEKSIRDGFITPITAGGF